MFAQLLSISPKNVIFLKTFNSEFSYIEVWFTGQNSIPLEIERKINVILVINQSTKYKIMSLAMQRYSVQPRDQIFVKGHGFLSFAKNKGWNIGKNISKYLSSKYGQKLIDHAKQSATDPIKTAS